MTAPSGFLSEPICALRDMFVASASFITWAGAGDAVAAAACAHLLETPSSPAARILIIDFGDMERDRYVVTNRRVFTHAAGSSLVAYFRADVSDSDSEAELLSFCNDIGAMWRDLEIASGQYDQGTLAIQSIALAAAPARIVHEKRERAGDFFEAALLIGYSRQPGGPS